MGKSSDGKTGIRKHREYTSLLPSVANGGSNISQQNDPSPARDTATSFSPEIPPPKTHDSADTELSTSNQASTTSNATSESAQSPGPSGEASTDQEETDVDERASGTNPEPPPRRLAASLSGRQLLNQRLQKYKLPAVFHANVVGPGQDQRWKGSFWIKGTFIGSSKLERTKGAAKEGAAMSALKWLNSNHYY